MRHFNGRNEIWVIRATGAIFLGFAANALWHAWERGSSELSEHRRPTAS